MNTVFCERLRTARKERGMSQVKFAERTGLDRTMLNKYEHGERQPAMDNLLQMARVLDCSLDWLCGLDD